MKQRARKLRQQQTDSENILWQKLRNRQLNGFKFRRQFILEPYIVDFICLDAKLIIEIDGSQHLEQQDYDSQRTLFLNSLGYTVNRYWNNDVINNTEAILEDILNSIKQNA